jgi:hypothetical protein
VTPDVETYVDICIAIARQKPTLDTDTVRVQAQAIAMQGRSHAQEETFLRRIAGVMQYWTPAEQESFLRQLGLGDWPIGAEDEVSS